MADVGAPQAWAFQFVMLLECLALERGQVQELFVLKTKPKGRNGQRGNLIASSVSFTVWSTWGLKNSLLLLALDILIGNIGKSEKTCNNGNQLALN